jgi:hypothetical protein
LSLWIGIDLHQLITPAGAAPSHRDAIALRLELFVALVDVRLDRARVRPAVRIDSIHEIVQLARGHPIRPVRDDVDDALPNRAANHQVRWERPTTGGAAKRQLGHAERIVAL